MRGWHNHSREHAMAARGIPSNSLSDFLAVQKEKDLEFEKQLNAPIEICGVKTDYSMQEIMDGWEENWYFDVTMEEFLGTRLENLDALCLTDKATLYRVVWADKPDIEKPGLFFTESRENINNELLGSLSEWNIGVGKWEDEPDTKIWLLTAEVSPSEIDIKETVKEIADFPYDKTIVLKSDKKVKIIGMEAVQ